MNKKFTWVLLLGILVLLILAGCGDVFMGRGPDGTPTYIPYDDWLWQSEATEAARTQWTIHGTPTPTATLTITPTPTPIISPTPTVTPSPTPFGGSLGTCFALPWNVNVTTYNEVVRDAVRIYPEGVTPTCSSDSSECVGVHVYCFNNGVWDGIDRGVAIEEPIIQATRPYFPYILLLWIGLPMLLLAIFVGPVLANYIKASMSADSFGPMASAGVEQGQGQGRSQNNSGNPTPSISIKEFNRLMRRWNTDASIAFFTWLFQKRPQWKDKILSSADPFFQTTQQWYQLLMEWNKVKTGKFIKWMEKTS